MTVGRQSFQRSLVLAIFAVALALPLLQACGDPGPPDDRLTPGADVPGGTAAAASGTPGTPSPTPDFRGVAANIGGIMVLATTTSPLDSGLLDVLAPLFTKLTGTEVQVLGVSTTAALEMAVKGTADAVFTDSAALEKKYLDSGDIVNGKLVMHNDLVIVGPAADPAKAKGLKDVSAVMKAIAATGPFVSRGDDSATHKTELALWEAAKVDPKSVRGRTESGLGMGATLSSADQKGAYTLTDRATYLALKKSLKLEIMFDGDPSLLNVYHIYTVAADKHPTVKKQQAEAWMAFLVAPATQQIIGDFKKAEGGGQSLFTPDAGKTESSLGR